jgi:hypothetical protein
MRVASLITRRSSTDRSSELVMSATRSRNSISCCRVFFMPSINWELCRATEACVAIASSRSRSSRVNLPARLLSVCTTPMISPRAVLIGAQRMDLVTKPVLRVDLVVEALVLVWIVDDQALAAFGTRSRPRRSC